MFLFMAHSREHSRVHDQMAVLLRGNCHRCQFVGKTEVQWSQIRSHSSEPCMWW